MHRRLAAIAALALLSTTAAAQARLPLKLAPRATKPAITVEDLMTRLYRFADDSMNGRVAGEKGGVMATAYIAAELQRLGLTPAGDDGTFFQAVPLVRRVAGDSSRLEAGGAALAPWTDFVPLRGGTFEGAAVFSGTLRDSAAWIGADAAKGKLVVLAATGGGIAMPSTEAGSRFAEVGALAIVIPDQVFPAYANYLRSGNTSLKQEEADAGPALVLVSATAAGKLLGAPVIDARPGAAGRPARGTLVVTEEILPARNVVAVLPGSDPALRHQYVAIGAHSDHEGPAPQALDHDSLRAVGAVLRPEGAESPARPGSPEDQARVKAILDSLRRLDPPRPDSIHNGADDDGSGSMGVLEIAEAMATATTKPRRSILFVWHTAEEMGLLGADWYTSHPTVPRDSIVAAINIDMIGRGAAGDLEGGGPAYLQLIGSRRLSTEFGDLVEKVNAEGKHGFTFDYQYDANGHPQQYYCRSDHYMYARHGIPVVFLSSGGHRDYHMVTDEPQYIDYERFRRVTQFIHDLALRTASLDRRPALDKPKPDPNGQCVQ